MLINSLRVCDITRAGFHLDDIVVDLIEQGSWIWSYAWYYLFQVLNQVKAPNLNNPTDDKLFWHDYNGHYKDSSIRLAWDTVRPQMNLVPWFHTVWFSLCIPWHAFLL